MSLVANTSNTSNHKRGPSVDIAELERKAEIVQDLDLSIESWITQANRLYDQARLSYDKGDLDNAYIQYLKFNNIVTNVLPQHQVGLRKRAFEVATILKDLRNSLLRKSDDVASQCSTNYHISKSGVVSPKRSVVSNHAQDLIRKFSAMAGTSQALQTLPPPNQSLPAKTTNSILRPQTQQKMPLKNSVQEEEVKRIVPRPEKLKISSDHSPNRCPIDEKPILRAPPRPKGSDMKQTPTQDKSNIKDKVSSAHVIPTVKPNHGSNETEKPLEISPIINSKAIIEDAKKPSETSVNSTSQPPKSPKVKKYVPTSVFASYRLEKRKSNAERHKSQVAVTDSTKIPSSLNESSQNPESLESNSNKKFSLSSEQQHAKCVYDNDKFESATTRDTARFNRNDDLSNSKSDSLDTHDLDLYESALKFPHIETIHDLSLSSSTIESDIDIDEVSERFPSLEQDGSIRTALLNARQAKARRHRVSKQIAEDEESTTTEHEVNSLNLSTENSIKSSDDLRKNNVKEDSPVLKPTRRQKSQYSFKTRAPSRRWSSSVSISQTNFAFPHATVISTEVLHRYLTQLSNPPSILLMDIRPRDDFQSGHINAKYIINIDPMILKNETTSSKIEAALLMCSKKEQSLFNERHKFDLIVFYDQNSTSLTQRPIELGGSLVANPLQHLVSAIYEREFEKVLIRMPVLLNGGYEAWKALYGEALAATQMSPEDIPAKVIDEENVSVRQFDKGGTQTYASTTESKRNVPGDWFDKLQDTYSKSKSHRLKQISANSNQMDLITEKLDRSAVITPAIGRPIALEIYDYFQQNPIPPQHLTHQPIIESHGTYQSIEHQHTFHNPRYVSSGPSLSTNQGYMQQHFSTIQQPCASQSYQPLSQSQQYDARLDSSRHLAPQVISQQPQINYPPRTPHPMISQSTMQLNSHPQQYPAYPPHPNPSRPQHIHQMQQAIGTTELPKKLQPEHQYPSASRRTQKASSEPSGQQNQSAHEPSQAMPQENKSGSNLRRRKTFLDNPYYGFTTTNSVRYDPPPPVPKRPLPLPPVVPVTSAQRVNQRLPSAVRSQNHQWKQQSSMIHNMPPEQHSYGQQRTAQVHATSPTFESSVLQLGSVRIGITGLKNLGNTCFMNSILQCLSATIPLARYFLDGSYKRHINTTNFLGTGGILAQAFGDLIRVMWSEQYTFVSPITFRDAIAKFAPQFKGSDQQDSQELLGFLLDGLHEDLNLIVNKPPPDNNEDDVMMETMPEQTASDLAWEKYLQRNSSIIVSLFQGQFRSRLQCTSCKQTSTTYNPFMYLSLPIPSVNQGISLSACLDEFVKEEILDGDDAWFCPRCKTRRRAIKRLTLSRLPDILLIHLKRFSFSGPFRDKLDTLVSYPLRKLDMRPYLPSTQSKAPAIYDLYAVSNHFGGLNGGHYTAQVRNGYRNQWHNFDDSRVSVCDERAVVCKSAYILFYVRTTVS